MSVQFLGVKVMRRIGMPASIGTAAILFLGMQLHLFSQEKGNGKANPPTELEGIWTEVFVENQGKFTSMLPPPGEKGGIIWKISADRFEMGPDDERFPIDRWTYQLVQATAKGGIDIAAFNGDGKKTANDKKKGIFYVKDDYLFLCINTDVAGPRPQKFATTGKDQKTLFLHVLRKGKLK